MSTISSISGGSSYYPQIQSGGGNQLSQIVSNLQTLQQQDPTEFQSVMSNIVDQLQSAAQNASGSQATALNNLASAFQNAEQSGNLSQLKQAVSGHHHHHHHGGGGGGGTQNTTSTSSSSTSLQSLLQNISSEVTQALGQSGSGS
jgi:hypothetical protein